MSETAPQVPETRIPSARRKRFWLLLLPLLAIGCFASLCFLPSFNSISRGPSSRRSVCKNNLTYIAYALDTYHNVHRSYPPAYVTDNDGRPLYSWRVLILPYIDERRLYDAYHLDEPWDSPHNLPLSKSVIDVFRCPGDKSDPMAATTNYVAVVGENTAWPGANSVRRRDMKDGSDKTIFLVEMAPATIGWAEPRDLSVSQIPLRINPPGETGISSHHHEQAQVVLCDGHVHALADDLPAATLWQLLQRNDKQPTDESWQPRE